MTLEAKAIFNSSSSPKDTMDYCITPRFLQSYTIILPYIKICVNKNTNIRLHFLIQKHHIVYPHCKIIHLSNFYTHSQKPRCKTTRLLICTAAQYNGITYDGSISFNVIFTLLSIINSTNFSASSRWFVDAAIPRTGFWNAPLSCLYFSLSVK